MIIFVGLVESHETSESELSTFWVIDIPKKPQAVMPSSFNTEVRPISPFRLLRLRSSLAAIINNVFVSYNCEANRTPYGIVKTGSFN